MIDTDVLSPEDLEHFETRPEFDDDGNETGKLIFKNPLTEVIRFLIQSFRSSEWFGSVEVEDQDDDEKGFTGGIKVYAGAHSTDTLSIQDESGNMVTLTGAQEITVPSVIIGQPELVPPSQGKNFEGRYKYFKSGTYNNGRDRYVRFPAITINDVQVDVYALRESTLSTNDDIMMFEFFLQEFEDINLFGNNFRTRMVESLSPRNVKTFTDISAAKGRIEIQRVPMINPRFIKETAKIEQFDLQLLCKEA